MVEYDKKSKLVKKNIKEVYNKIKETLGEWELLFENRAEDQAELLYLVGMFSGAGVLAFIQHGARKAILFVKLFKRDENSTEVVAITGGSENIWGFDYRRHENNLNHVFDIFRDVDIIETHELQSIFSSEEAFIEAITAEERGELESALGLYNKVIKLDPENMSAFYSKGKILALLKRNEEAIECLEDALKLESNVKELINSIKELKVILEKQISLKYA